MDPDGPGRREGLAMAGHENSGGTTRGRPDRRQQVGRAGEDHAESLLRSRGAVVLSRNWYCAVGELDLVVLDPAGRLRFVEVRARTGTGFGTPAESVTGDKLRRLQLVARRWLAANPGGWRQVCFDVVGVDLSDPDNPRLELFEDVV